MKVVVVGNCTLDFFFRVARFPEAGETLLATSRMVDVGGKGANQAVAASRCGIETLLFASLGRDAEAETMRRRLEAESVILDHLMTSPEPSDQSIIYVTPDGENSIVSSHACAAAVAPADTQAILDRVETGDVVLMQGNLSLEVTRGTLGHAKRRSARTLLNAVPINYDYETLWPLVDCVILNQAEVRELGGAADPRAGAGLLLAKGVGSVIVTLGARGAILVSDLGTVEVAALAVEAVDTTGAGDVFCGALAAGLARGLAMGQAAAFAVRAASSSVTRPGTQSSFPTVEELRGMLTSAEKPSPGTRETPP